MKKNIDRLSILCYYRDDSVITHAMQVIKDWSSDEKGHRQFGWFKKSPNTVSLFIVLPSEIDPSRKAALYSHLIQIPGLSFINTSFS